jgi:hypothetical protein
VREPEINKKGEEIREKLSTGGKKKINTQFGNDKVVFPEVIIWVSSAPRTLI